MTDVTQILSQIESGDRSATEQLLSLVYHELRKLAAAKLAQEKPGQTLQATALVHEAYLRLVNIPSSEGCLSEGGEECLQSVQWNSRRHFFAAAAEAMRRVLVDQARRKSSQKHGGYLSRIDLDEDAFVRPEMTAEILAVHEALDGLGQEDSLAAELVKLHYFAGLSLEEAAHCLGLSRATGYRTWTYAKAWLRATLQDQEQFQ